MMINPEKKAALIRHIQSREESGREILLTPEHYFDGYEEDHCTICANNEEPVSTKEFSDRLQEIGARPDVTGVFVRFYDYEDALADETCWIGSDSVYVVTSVRLTDVKAWFADFEPSTVTEQNDFSSFDDLPAIPRGSRLIQIWWD